MADNSGFNPGIKGLKTKDGDTYTGNWCRDDDDPKKFWYEAVSIGGVFETSEVPVLFTLVRFADGTPEAEVKDYFKKNGVQNGKTN